MKTACVSLASSPSDLFLEPLEDRIAPASATFVDVDGDTITITTSKGTSNDIVNAVTGGANSEIELIDLTTNPLFKGTNIKVAVTARGADGDGLANVWRINATGMDLGSVEVVGDLGKLTAGDADYKTSVKSVKVQSIGKNGGASAFDWQMLGSTTSFSVASDVIGAKLHWHNPDTGGNLTVGSIVIGGNLVGGSADDTGLVLLTTGDGGASQLKTLSIGGNLEATNYNRTAAVFVGDVNETYAGYIGKTTIGGSLLGFAAKENNATIFAANSLGSVTVEGSLIGGGNRSGTIFSSGLITGEVKIGGSAVGGGGLYSGSVFASSSVKNAVSIGGSLSGGAGAYSGSVISLNGSLNNVSVGLYLSGNSGVFSGAIYGDTGLGNVSVGGSVFGSSNNNSGFIGTDTSNGTNFKVGTISVGGDLVGGSDFSTGAIIVGSANAISIGGSLIGGNTVAGTGSIYVLESVKSIAVAGDLLGTSKNYSGSIRVLGDSAKISSINIGGTLAGDAGIFSGSIEIDGSVDKLSIGGGLGGGGGMNSGSLFFDTIKNLQIGTGTFIIGSIYGGSASGAGVVSGEVLGTAVIKGNIFGGSASNTGKIMATTVKDLTIGGNLTGGAAADTGAVEIGGGSLTGKLTIAGNVIGSNDLSNTGVIKVSGNAKAIEIKGNLVGGNATMANKVNAGAVLVEGALKSMTVGGSIKGGTYAGNTDLNLGAVRAGSIDTMVVKGSILGPNANSRVIITGQGDINKVSGTNYAIKTLTVHGSVHNAMILGGYNTTGTTIGGDGGNNGGGAQIGTVTVHGNFTNGSIATGVNNDAATFGSWADGTNTLLNDNPIVASIAKIVIKGSAFADTQSGISAELIKSLTIGGGLVVPVGSGAQAFAVAGNFRVQQVVA